MSARRPCGTDASPTKGPTFRVPQHTPSRCDSVRRSVWVGANGGPVEHWDGTSWSDASGGFLYYASALWGSGAPNDLWAVGPYGAVLHHR